MAKPAKTVNIFEAKTNLSKLIAKAEKGEDVVIARAAVGLWGGPWAIASQHADEPR